MLIVLWLWLSHFLVKIKSRWKTTDGILMIFLFETFAGYITTPNSVVLLFAKCSIYVLYNSTAQLLAHVWALAHIAVSLPQRLKQKHSSLWFPPPRRGAIATIWWWYGWNSQLLNKFKRNANQTISTSSNSSNITKINPSETSSPSNLQNLNLQPTKIRSEAFSNRHTLPKTNSSPIKMDGWKMIHFLLGAYFQGGDMLVSGRVSSQMTGKPHRSSPGHRCHQWPPSDQREKAWYRGKVVTILVSLVGMKKNILSLQICGFICIFVNLKCIYIYIQYIYI